MRGKELNEEAEQQQQGSPPPMRGKDLDLTGRIVGTRITPAHAGKRCFQIRHSRLHRDHPRPCGEKIDENKRKVVDGGSPPPMRGKGAGSANCRGAAGITPAHAGKSTLR